MARAALVFLAALLLAAAPARAGDDLADRAKALVEHLSHGEWELAETHFDAKMKEVLPPAKLEGLWGQLTAQCGPLGAVGEPRPEKVNGSDARFLRCDFARVALDTKVIFDGEGKVAGLFFAPAETPDAGPPAYADRAKFEESEATVGAEGWPLPATLATPKGEGPFPAVVLVHGSGPHDRDESIFGTKVFRDLAWGLASRGVAVLRYEKRTKAHGARWKSSMTVEDETIADALTACEALAKAPRVDKKRVFLLGHSLGGCLAPEIARRAPALAGAVLLAPSTRPLEEVILEQQEHMLAEDGVVTPEKLDQVAETRAVALALRARKLPEDAPALGLAARYFYAFDAIDTIGLARSLGRPILALQGGRDMQVSPFRDFLPLRDALKDAPQAAFRLYPRLNHLFVAGEGRGSVAEYQKPGHVDEKVVADVAAWILGGKLPPESRD
jgi:dienelactone hydrolase